MTVLQGMYKVIFHYMNIDIKGDPKPLKTWYLNKKFNVLSISELYNFLILSANHFIVWLYT